MLKKLHVDQNYVHQKNAKFIKPQNIVLKMYTILIKKNYLLQQDTSTLIMNRRMQKDQIKGQKTTTALIAQVSWTYMVAADTFLKLVSQDITRTNICPSKIGHLSHNDNNTMNSSNMENIVCLMLKMFSFNHHIPVSSTGGNH